MATPVDSKLYDETKKKVDKIYDKPSAYRSMAYTRFYLRAFREKYGNTKKAYSGKKPGDLETWRREKWIDIGSYLDTPRAPKSCGAVEYGKGEYPLCMPESQAKKYSDKELEALLYQKSQIGKTRLVKAPFLRDVFGKPLETVEGSDIKPLKPVVRQEKVVRQKIRMVKEPKVKVSRAKELPEQVEKRKRGRPVKERYPEIVDGEEMPREKKPPAPRERKVRTPKAPRTKVGVLAPTPLNEEGLFSMSFGDEQSPSGNINTILRGAEPKKPRQPKAAPAPKATPAPKPTPVAVAAPVRREAQYTGIPQSIIDDAAEYMRNKQRNKQ
jgi:hypothetical protein